MSTNILEINNNNNIKDVTKNQMQQFNEIEREDMRIQKNERNIATTTND
jgi:hypothetical protein